MLKRLHFLRCFPAFTRLLEESSIRLPFTGVSLSFVPTLLDDPDLVIDDVSYSGIGLDDAQFFDHVVVPLANVLEAEERHFILKETMDLTDIWNYQSFQQFLKSGEFNSEHSETYLEFRLHFIDESSSVDYTNGDDLVEEYVTLDNLQMYYVNEEDGNFECTNWISDPSLRLKVITGVIANPNLVAQKDMIELFTREEAFEVASRTVPITVHYSDFENNRIAFDIKVYELFAHDKLLELGLISYDTESDNRQSVLDSLIEYLNSETSLEYEGSSGSSGGYAIFSSDAMTPELILKACRIVEKSKLHAADYYQTLEAYEHCFDDFLSELQDMDQADDDVRQLTNDIKAYIQNVQSI